MFPVRNKIPLTPHGFKNAVKDEKEIKALFENYPSATGYGIATGSGLCVIDVDPKHGGFDQLKMLEEKYGTFPKTPTVKTGGGGRHYYFKTSVPIKSVNAVLAPGIDSKADGGYAIGPGSSHELGGMYEWENSPDECEMAELPKWIEKLLVIPSQSSKRNDHTPHDSEKVPEGQRNQYLASAAGSMRRKGLSPETIAEALQVENQQRCDPPLADAEVTRIADSISKYEPSAPILPALPDVSGSDETTLIQAQFFQLAQIKGLSASELRKRMTEVVLEHLNKRGHFYFHAERKSFEAAMYFDSRRKLLSRLATDEFQSWLSTYLGINRTEQTFKFIFAAVEDEALNGNTTGLVPEKYWASRHGTCYLSNGDGAIVRMSAGGVDCCDNGTDGVLFAAGCTLKPWQLTEPIDPFEACALFRDITASDNGREIYRLWVCSLPTNQRCKPPLCCAGPVSSGKTRVSLGVFELFGIPERVTAVTKNGEDDFWTELDAGGLVCFDNADTRVDWLPDALAAAATDVGREKRKLYSDSQLVHQRAKAWTIITSSNPTFAADPGLADRVLVVRMDSRGADATAESSLSVEIQVNRNAGLSWIVQTISKALASAEAVPTGLNRRHPDFAAFGVRLGRAMNREKQAIAALRAAEADKSRFNLENDDLGNMLMELLSRGDAFEGSAEDLLTALMSIDPNLDQKYWTPKRVGKRMAKLWPHISAMYTSRHYRTGRERSYDISPKLSNVFEQSSNDSDESRPESMTCVTFEEVISENSYERDLYRTYAKTPPETSQTSLAESGKEPELDLLDYGFPPPPASACSESHNPIETQFLQPWVFSQVRGD